MTNASSTDLADNGQPTVPASEATNDAAKESAIADADQTPQVPLSSEVAGTASMEAPAPVEASTEKKWPGWPGDNVFRLIVPVLKVGSIIGRKGEYIKKMCEETRARIRILEAAIGTSDRIVLISGKEELDAEISPAMEAVLRVFKRVNGLSESEDDGTGSAAGTAMCSVRLLAASAQTMSLIGKQGSVIKSIQESSGATIRVLSGGEVPYAAPDEKIVEIQGESQTVVKALEAVVGQLRKFLVDHSVIPLFEKSYSGTVSQDRAVDTKTENIQTFLHPASQPGTGSDYPLSSKRDSYFIDRETPVDSQIKHSGLSLHGQDPALTRLRPSGLGRTTAPIVTQVTQTMQIPLSYAEDIIGIGGTNIGYIRRISGAILTVQESRGLPDEIIVEVKGTSSQVQTAQQLIQEFINSHGEPVSSSYGKTDTGLRSYSQLANTSYPSSFSTPPLGDYGSSAGGYSGFRL